MSNEVEDRLKEILLEYYTPPLKTTMSPVRVEELENLANECWKDSSPLIQGYSFINDLNLRQFLRVLIKTTPNPILDSSYINAYRFVEEFFSRKTAIEDYCESSSVFITFGYGEPNKNQTFEYNNYLAKMRAKESKKTFILSLEKTNGFCVPLIPITGTTINDIPKITSQWKWDFWETKVLELSA